MDVHPVPRGCLRCRRRYGGVRPGTSAWQTAIPTPMAATDLTDTDSLLAATPILRGQLLQLQSTLAHPMNTPALLLKPLGAALRTHGIQRTLVSAIQRTAHKQIMQAYGDYTLQRAILISQTAKNTGAHLQQLNSEAYEADDRCFQVSMARRLMLTHPAANSPPTSHPRAPTSAPPRASVRVASTPTSSTASYARAEEVSTNDTPRSPDA